MQSSPPNPENATLLLNATAAGDKAAADRLLPLVYEQLRKAAQQQMAGERSDHTLSSTALVHDAYLKLIGPRDVPWAGRGHFYAAAAEAMRRILVDYARTKAASGRARAGWLEARDLAGLVCSEDSDGILAFDGALARLEKIDGEAAQVVRLRFFAGLSVDDTALALGISPRTVDREWAFARAWLLEAIKSGVG